MASRSVGWEVVGANFGDSLIFGFDRGEIAGEALS
jgi:hypothetical protein